MGLPSFGARSFAGNLSVDEFKEAIDYAHLFQRKVYLTYNILMKDRELSEALELLKPLYEAGLDGVIVQDTGLISLISKNFRGLEVHVSTQGFITGVHGARLMKELGACRVVPARELSLKEIRDIKEKAGIEVECFIHGAMCYSYSGMCLMSSFLGGRSGNRGRCAGPCRQPYEGNDYILSMKDLCTIKDLGSLLSSGVDSLKIEGRMKSKEYVYFVTRIYRKYIDEYYEKGSIKVSDKDLQDLVSLYSRSGLNPGYLYKHNGPEMITRKKGNYVTDLPAIPDNKENADSLFIPVSMEAVFKKGEPARIRLFSGKHGAEAEGDIVEEAKNRPLNPADIEKQLKKTGRSAFIARDIKINGDYDIFMPLSGINELRRRGLNKLKEDILSEYRRSL